MPRLMSQRSATQPTNANDMHAACSTSSAAKESHDMHLLQPALLLLLGSLPMFAQTLPAWAADEASTSVQAAAEAVFEDSAPSDPIVTAFFLLVVLLLTAVTLGVSACNHASHGSPPHPCQHVSRVNSLAL